MAQRYLRLYPIRYAPRSALSAPAPRAGGRDTRSMRAVRASIEVLKTARMSVARGTRSCRARSSSPLRLEESGPPEA